MSKCKAVMDSQKITEIKVKTPTIQTQEQANKVESCHKN